MHKLKIRDIRAIAVQPGRTPLVVVRIDTSEPGLYGLGCATFTQRFAAVTACIDRHLRPFLLGKDPAAVVDTWHTSMVNGYWRNGPVVNNAVGGVDMALWDIKAKAAGMPCYELWGGACRPAAAVYVHANGNGNGAEQVVESARRFMEQGFTHIRCQLGGYNGVTGGGPHQPDGTPPGRYFSAREKLRLVPGLFQRLRDELGQEVELLHDVHERLAPSDAVWLAKALEPYRLFFLEDVLAPEDVGWFETIRRQCATPLAMGELFVHPGEIVPLVSGRLIDFIRLHPSAFGGVTPCIQLAHMAEFFGVRTAWHGPGDVSPVGMAANVHMDVHLHNFGIQEWAFRSELEQEMFPGIPRVQKGYAYPNDRLGWGIDFDLALAERYPARAEAVAWTETRLPDGTAVRP